VPLDNIHGLIDSFARRHPGSEVWLAARNFETGGRVGIGETLPVRTASTIKLPILCALHQGALEGRWGFDDKVRMTTSDKVSGSGIIRELADGTELSLRDLAHVMIVVSDNTATNLILDRITADYVNGCLDTWGLPRTRSMRKILGDGNNLKPVASGWSRAGQLPENKRFGIGSSSPAEMVRLLEMIERGEIASPAASKDILATMGRQRYKDGIGRWLGAKMLVESKSGALDTLRSDVGLVRSPGGRVAMAITVDGMPKIDYSADNAGNLLIADLAEEMLRLLSKPA
jgi:beta-lactamase class A